MNFLKRFGADFVRVSIAAVLLAGISSASAQVWRWSTTPGSNATADPSVNWAEGMAPSGVNDSARAMMASVAKSRDDLSGLLTTSGTASAYNVTTNSGVTSPPPTGFTLAVRVNVTNSIGATLAADGGTAFPIRSASGIAIPGGVLVSGSPYTLFFDGSAWLLKEFYGQPFSVPLGGIIDYTGTSSPNSNFVVPEGQCISRTSYAAYFALVGTTYGGCDGSTTFAVIDTRGRVLAGDDNGVGRLTCHAVNGCGAQSKQLIQNELPAHAHAFSGTTGGQSRTHTHDYQALTIGNSAASGSDFTAARLVATTSPTSDPSQDHEHSFGGVTSTTGSGQAFSILQPTIPTKKLLRVL